MEVPPGSILANLLFITTAGVPVGAVSSGKDFATHCGIRYILIYIIFCIIFFVFYYFMPFAAWQPEKANKI